MVPYTKGSGETGVFAPTPSLELITHCTTLVVSCYCLGGLENYRGGFASGASLKFTPGKMDFRHNMEYFSDGGFRIHKIVRDVYFVV